MAIFNPLTAIGKFFIVSGLVLAVVGLLMLVSARFGFTWRVPGDIFIHRRNFTIYFPIVTMLLVSFVLTVVLNLFFRK